MVTFVEVAHRPAVRNDMPLEAPLAPQNVFEQVLASAAWFTKRSIICAHHRLNACINERLECGKVCFKQIFFAYHCVEFVAVFFRSGVNGIMFCTRCNLQMVRVGALQSFYKGSAHARSEVGVLAVCFLSASPARITEYVDVRRPECKAAVLGCRKTGFLRLVPFCARFSRNDVGFLLSKLVIERSCKSDCLRENGCLTLACHAMQTFAPPVVRRNAHFLNFHAFVQHERYLFLKRHFLYHCANFLLPFFLKFAHFFCLLFPFLRSIMPYLRK